MKIKTILRKGFEHKIYCEDYLYSFQNDNWIIAAVFDGCSDGVDSHFASSLSGKILKSIVLGNNGEFHDSLTTDDVFRALNFKFLSELDYMRKKLRLPGNELLSTMILLVYNKHSELGKIIAMGDGIVVINGEITIIDQNNEPEYPIKYAKKVANSMADTGIFLTEHKNLWTFHGLEDVTISTDGLQQLKNMKDSSKHYTEAMEYFITNTDMSHLDVMLARKYNILKLKGWENLDDLGMIRIINDEKNASENQEDFDINRVHSTVE